MSPGQMTLADWLDDLCVRFIVNLPTEELSVAERICFQIEEAQWFYEDFIRPLDPDLPSLNLRTFCAVIFQHCPLLCDFPAHVQTDAFAAFLKYKTIVPVRGAILLNHEMDKVLLVKGWKKSATWSFPRGKIDKDEADRACAIREVYEETGYDLNEAGLVAQEEKDSKYITVCMRGQDIRLYVFRGIPLTTPFAPRTRKEISEIAWHHLADLPNVKRKKASLSVDSGPASAPGLTEDLAINANKFYMVAPFLGPLKKWIALQRKNDRRAVVESDDETSKTQITSSLSHDVSNAANKIQARSHDPAKETDRFEDVSQTTEQAHIDRLLRSLQESSYRRFGGVSANDANEASNMSSQIGQNSKSISLMNLLKPGNKDHDIRKVERSSSSRSQQIARAQNHQKRVELEIQEFSKSKTRQSETGVQRPQPDVSQVSNNLETTAVNTSSSNSFHHLSQVMPQASQVSQTPQSTSSLRSSINSNSLPVASTSHIMGQPHGQANLNFRFNALAPYQRPDDRLAPNLDRSVNLTHSRVPAAHQLPTPQLSSQASGLLNLFKNNASTRNGITANKAADSTFPPANHETAPEMAFERQEMNPSSDYRNPSRNHVQNDQSRPSGTETILPASSHSRSLLTLFSAQTISGDHEPSQSGKGQPQDKPSQQIHHSSLDQGNQDLIKPKSNSTSFDPRFGMHSTQPSSPHKMASQTKQPPKILSHPANAGCPNPFSTGSPHHKDSKTIPNDRASHHNKNVPQKSTPRVKTSKLHASPTPIATPVRILQRPKSPTLVSASRTTNHLVDQSPGMSNVSVKNDKNGKQASTPPQAPDLKPHTVPPKQFQPQILRRTYPSELGAVPNGELSPMPPLPSPRTASAKTVLDTRNSILPAAADHRKSLLSLFTRDSSEGTQNLETTAGSAKKSDMKDIGSPRPLPSHAHSNDRRPIPTSRSPENTKAFSTDTTSPSHSRPPASTLLDLFKSASPSMPYPSSSKVAGRQTHDLPSEEESSPSRTLERLSPPESGLRLESVPTPSQGPSNTSNGPAPDQREFLLGFLAGVVKSG